MPILRLNLERFQDTPVLATVSLVSTKSKVLVLSGEETLSTCLDISLLKRSTSLLRIPSRLCFQSTVLRLTSVCFSWSIWPPVVSQVLVPFVLCTLLTMQEPDLHPMSAVERDNLAVFPIVLSKP